MVKTKDEIIHELPVVILDTNKNTTIQGIVWFILPTLTHWIVLYPTQKDSFVIGLLLAKEVVVTLRVK